MPIDTTLPSIASEARTWRHDFHAHPETAFEEVRTSSLVAERLRAFGVDHVETGVAGTGVVGVIEGHLPGPGRRIALRADMDALPIEELGDIPYRSTIQGRMHACGHDGHTAMLLGAAKHLAATRAFSGTVVLVFQPAEESGFVGAKRMIEAGLLERYPVEQIFALHNWPGLPVGTIAIRRGAVMAAFDTFSVRIRGKGAHASKPHRSIDPLVTGAHLVSALQSIVSRSVDPFQMAVVSVCTLRGGDINNVIPHTAEITGSVRTYARETQSTIADRIVEISKGIGQAFGAAVEAAYERCQPAVINDVAATELARAAAGRAGLAVIDDWPPSSGGEDFSFFLDRVPGAFLLLGNGETEELHHPAYDFNDNALAYGIRALVSLAEFRP